MGKDTTNKPKKGKVIGASITGAIALVCLGLMIYCFCYVSQYTGKERSNLIGNAIFFLVLFEVLMIVTHYLAKTYLEDNGPNGYCSFLYIVSFLFFYLGILLVLIGYGIAKLIKMLGENSSSQNPEIEIKDDKGEKHKLKYYASSNGVKYYKDEKGNEWKTYNDKEFEQCK